MQMHHRSRQILTPAVLLGLLTLIALAMALLALAVPGVNIELPVTPTFNGYPISPLGL
jgi:hypothetical protein